VPYLTQGARLRLLGRRHWLALGNAAQAGIDRAQGNLLPANELHEVEQLARSGKVGMAGDGINDAPYRLCHGRGGHRHGRRGADG